MDELLVLYDFEFVPYQNPPNTKDRFEEDLRAFIQSLGLAFGLSALGGMTHCRGEVRGQGRSVTEEDRQALASWAGRQRVRCTARLGRLEEDHGGIQFLQPITEWVFAIDNLTDEDRAEAAAWHERIRQWVRPTRSAEPEVGG